MNDLESSKHLAHHPSGMEMLDKIDDIRSLHSVSDLTTLISHSPSDYSYFNFDKLKLHDLPKHLKRIANQLVVANRNVDANNIQDPNRPNQIKIRNKREAPKLDFHDSMDLQKYFKVTKKTTYLCDRTIEKRSEKASHLETERQLDYNSREMFQPYFKPIAVLSIFL